jgi:molybdopterin molybdotransferase
MADCCSAPGLLPFEQALTKMLAAITPVTDTEQIAIEQGLNRVLAHTITSPLNVPPHANSAMDGYAFAMASLADNQMLTLAGRSMAGAPYQGECPAGHGIRIMTGAKLPLGCDTVEMQENCQLSADGQQISLTQTARLGAHVRRAGEDIEQGQTVFQLGQRLTAIDIGILSSLGIASIRVYRKLTVGLIATGDELKLPGQVLAEGDIYESNAHVLANLLAKMNVEVINFGIIADDYDLIKQAFIDADRQCDAVVSSGGVSVGDADYTKMVLDELGQISFWKIAMKPGKPFAFGKLPHSVFFGLPGNPVSALVTAHQLMVPALLTMQQASVQARLTIRVKTADSLRKGVGRTDFQRGVLTVNAQGETVVRSTGSQGSGILSSLANANCYIVLPAEQGHVAAGELVSVQLFDQYLQ